MPETAPTIVPLGRIARVGALAVIGSIVANLIALFIAKAILPLPEDFGPLTPGPVIFFTALFTVIAVIVFAIVARVARQPIRTYRIIGVIAFFLSLIPDIGLLVNPEAAPMPGATPLAVLVLILFHLIAAIITIGLLTTRTVESQ